MVSDSVGVTEAAREIECRARDISDAFYAGHLDESKVFRASGRRIIPRSYLPTIREVLIARGKIRQPEAVS